MNHEKFRKYCLTKKGCSEDMPFDGQTLCFRVGGKIFAITDIEKTPVSFNLKCNPERAIELREEFEAITPGWHMNKKHWNTITPDETIPDSLIYELIDHSYELVFKSLKKADRVDISDAFK